MSLWMTDWKVGCWDHVFLKDYKPTFKIPAELYDKYTNYGLTVMPAGPLVESYRMVGHVGSYSGVSGNLISEVNVNWKSDVYNVKNRRKVLLGPKSQEINVYHSQCAFSGTWLLMHELERKIERYNNNIGNFSKVKDKIVKYKEDWNELVYQVLIYINDKMEKDWTHIERYIREHKDSTVIPRTMFYKSTKWGGLTKEDVIHLFDISKGYIEWLLADYPVRKNYILNPLQVGRGIRARSPEITKISDYYQLEFERSRQVGFTPIHSTWFAFFKDKMGLMKMIKAESESIVEKMLNAPVDVHLPSLEGGNYWKHIADLIYDGKVLCNGDGKNWETWVSLGLDARWSGVADGIDQLLSGGALTSVLGTILNIMITPCQDTKDLEEIAALGDDKLLVYKKDKDRSTLESNQIEGVWEIDPIATSDNIILGMVILDDYKGTYPGLYRLTIDRGEDRIPAELDKEIEVKGSKITPESYLLYKEIMSEGTLDGEPLISRIADFNAEEFWEGYRRDRYTFMEDIGQRKPLFEVVPEDVSE